MNPQPTSTLPTDVITDNSHMKPVLPSSDSTKDMDEINYSSSSSFTNPNNENEICTIHIASSGGFLPIVKYLIEEQNVDIEFK